MYTLSVIFEGRPDGGLRAWSDDLPGLILSHRDADAVIRDVPEAISVIIGHKLNREIRVMETHNIREILADAGVIQPTVSADGKSRKEYAVNVCEPA